MAIQHIRQIFHKGFWKDLEWHSDDGCYHCADETGADADELAERLKAEDAAWRAENPGWLEDSARPVRSIMGTSFDQPIDYGRFGAGPLPRSPARSSKA